LATGIIKVVRRIIINPKINKLLNILIFGSLILGILSIFLEYGFYLKEDFIFSQIDIVVAGILMSGIFFKLFLASHKIAFLKSNRVNFIIIFLFFFLIFFFAQVKSLNNAFSIASKVYILSYLFIRIPRFNRVLVNLRLNPASTVIFTFLTIIAIGTLLLLMPRCTSAGHETGFLEALFTATSATCVTGLVVVDTATHYSLWGQLIILMLIQIGGLGLMTFTSFFALVLSRDLGIRDRAVLGDILNYKSFGRIGSLIISILILTFIIEGCGAFLLYWQFLPQAKNTLSCIYSAIFHSVSAFCNAGFSLYSDSFQGYKMDPGVNLVMTTLIILGGLGFTVIVNLLNWGASRLKRKKIILNLQSKLVLTSTLILIAMGFILILIGEEGEVLKNLSWKGKLWGAYFQSVTARTAGFSTLNISSLSNFSSLLLIILMFIGASPGSTGGGIKTSTFITLLVTIKSMIKGRRRVEVFKRTIPQLIIYQALCVVILAFGWVSVSTLILSLTENAPFMDILFEEISAFGTVGLTRGLTPHLTLPGRIIIILTMLTGRIGPLTLALSMMRRKAIMKAYEYPEERIMIG